MAYTSQSPRWSKSFGLADPISVSDLIDHRDPMKAIDNLYTIGRICCEMSLSHPAVISLEVGDQAMF